MVVVAFLLKRVLWALFALFGISLVTFAMVDLAPADKQKLTDDIQRHEENIKALGRELEQTRQSMTAATRTAMKPPISCATQ